MMSRDFCIIDEKSSEAPIIGTLSNGTFKVDMDDEGMVFQILMLSDVLLFGDENGKEYSKDEFLEEIGWKEKKEKRKDMKGLFFDDQLKKKIYKNDER